MSVVEAITGRSGESISAYLKRATELERCMLTYDVASDFSGKSVVYGKLQRGGTRPGAYRPLRAGAWTEHSFRSPDLLDVSAVSLARFDSVLSTGADLNYSVQKRKYPAMSDIVLNETSTNLTYAPISLSQIAHSASLTGIIVTMLEHPHTIPALRAVLAVGGYGGLKTAADNVFCYGLMANDFVNPAPTNTWTFNNLRVLADVLNPHGSKNHKMTNATIGRLTKAFNGFLNTVGPDAAIVLFDNPAMYLEHGRTLLQSENYTDRANGIEFMTFAMQIEKIIQSNRNNFMGVHLTDSNDNQSPFYEVGCVGHKMVGTIADQVIDTLTTMALNHVQNPTKHLQRCVVPPNIQDDRSEFERFVNHLNTALESFLLEERYDYSDATMRFQLHRAALTFSRQQEYTRFNSYQHALHVASHYF